MFFLIQPKYRIEKYKLLDYIKVVFVKEYRNKRIDFTILNLQKGNILSKFVLNFQLHNAMDNTLILSPDGKVLKGVRDKSITSVIVPDSVTEIGSCAFEGCTSLSNIDIPNSVKGIGGGAFKG